MLMDSRQSADRHAASEHDVPSDLRCIGQLVLIAELAVVRHVRARHQQVAATEHSLRAGRTTMDRNELAHTIIRSQTEPPLLRLLLSQLRRRTQHGMRADSAAPTDRAHPVDNAVCIHPCIGAQMNARADHSIWTDPYTVV
jgi:hypothetical protein